MTETAISLTDFSMGFGVGMGIWFFAYWISRVFAMFVSLSR